MGSKTVHTVPKFNKLLRLCCFEVGQEVAAGDTVVVLEAMKMANALQAEKAGKISAIVVKVGQSVMEDEALVYIE